jgi:hypothetical protein
MNNDKLEYRTKKWIRARLLGLLDLYGLNWAYHRLSNLEETVDRFKVEPQSSILKSLLNTWKLQIEIIDAWIDDKNEPKKQLGLNNTIIEV